MIANKSSRRILEYELQCYINGENDSDLPVYASLYVSADGEFHLLGMSTGVQFTDQCDLLLYPIR